LGQPVNTTYRSDLAQRVLSLDCDFLSPIFPGYVRYSREFIARRRVTEANREMNRLYVVATTPSNTGAIADHVWEVKPSEFEAIAKAIATGAGAQLPPGSAAVNLAWIEPLVRDLQQHKGASIVVVGGNQPPIIHALAHAMNNALGNVGKTVFYTDPLEVNSVDHNQSLQELLTDLDAGAVDLLVIIGGNPVYNAPADLGFLKRFQQAKLRVHLSEYRDETSEWCHWHVPAAHFLESWGDTRSYDGTVTIMQPLIEPLYDGKTTYEILQIFAGGQSDRKPYDIVKAYWQKQRAGGGNQQPVGEINRDAQPATAATPAPRPTPSADFETWWRQTIHDGFIPDSAFQPKTVALNSAWASQQTPAQQPSGGGFELVFRTDPSIYDGRFANNGWLQELPRPLTKITWDNVAVVSPRSAQQLAGVDNNGGAVKGREHYVPVVDITTPQNQTVKAPLWIMPGQPDGVITVHLGYGRRLAGKVGSGQVGYAAPDEIVGFDAYTIRASFAPWYIPGVQVRRSAGDHLLATTQLHFNLEDPKFATEERDVVRSQTLEQFLHGEGHEEHEQHPTLYPDYHYDNQAENAPNYAWGMAIDLNNCIGCNACTVACQSENNIPVVGKHEVVRSREMHWIRVDAYFKGEPENPEGPYFQPVP